MKGTFGYSAQPILPTIFQNERDRISETFQGLLLRAALTVSARNLRRVGNEPRIVSFDNGREHVTHRLQALGM